MIPNRAVLVVDLFAEERTRLLDVLEGLSPEQWLLSTPCPGWTVKDIVAHLLGDELNNLSGGRDHHSQGRFTGSTWQELVDGINQLNEAWVDALRGLSPRVLVDLLVFAGEQVRDYFSSLDPMSNGPNVAWAGPGSMPMWLHLAREYTERWAHQMQIRQAVGAPDLYEPRLFHPVLNTFVHALPVAYADVSAPPGTHVAVEIAGAAGGTWSLVRGTDGWALWEDVDSAPAAVVRLDEDTAWRLWTRNINRDVARSRVTVRGDERLGESVLDAVAMIV